MILRIIVLLLLLGPSAFCHDVIGYLPEYRVNQQTLGTLKHCTDVVYFGSEIGADGNIVFPKNAATQLGQIRTSIQNQKRPNKTRLILCLGGWAKDKHFPAVTSSKEKRQRFADSLLKAVKTYHFDGVDLDWEYPKNDQQWRDLGKLIQAGKKSLGKRPFIWSTAVSTQHTVPLDVVALLDRIHLMTYDAGQKHCHPNIARKAVQAWKKHGVDTRKLCIGVAFYGRKMSQRNDVKTYSQIHQTYGDTAKRTQTAGGYYYDNPASCKIKKQIVKQSKLRGIIIWEIGQDAPGNAGLLPLLK